MTQPDDHTPSTRASNEHSRMSKKDTQPDLVPRLRFSEFIDAPGWETRSGDQLFDSINNQASADGLPVLAITQEHGAIPRDEINYHVSVSSKSIESYKEVCQGDFIISLRSFQGGIEYSSYHGICSPAYVILRQKFRGSSDFFQHYFKSDRFIRQLTRNLEGLRDGKMISYKQFCDQDLLFPNPREREKIADTLASLDELIEAESRKLQALGDHKKGLMQQLFPREGQTRPERRFPKFRDAPEWAKKKLDDIAEISSGTTPARSNPGFYDGGSIPWVKTTDLNNSFITYTEESITESANARVNPVGSILVAMYGGFKQIGRTGFLTFPAATNQALSVLVVNCEGLLPNFLLCWLNANVNEWKRIASSSRKDPNITGSDVAAFPIRYPDKSEQQTITDCFASLDAMIAAQADKLDVLRTHKRGLMQQLFPSPDGVEA